MARGEQQVEWRKKIYKVQDPTVACYDMCEGQKANGVRKKENGEAVQRRRET